MTREETKQILMRVETSFPNWKPTAPLAIVIDTWNEMLTNFTYEQVLSAVKAYIVSDSSGFAPTIGKVIEMLYLLYHNENEINEIEAWNLVLKAIRNSAYHAEEEFSKLPPIIQRTIVNPGQLREWGLLEDVDGKGMIVMQSNFMRVYRQEQARERNNIKFNPDILKLLNNTAPISLSKEENKKLPVNIEREIAEKSRVPISDRIQHKIEDVRKKLGLSKNKN